MNNDLVNLIRDEMGEPEGNDEFFKRLGYRLHDAGYRKVPTVEEIAKAGPISMENAQAIHDLMMKGE